MPGAVDFLSVTRVTGWVINSEYQMVDVFLGDKILASLSLEIDRHDVSAQYQWKTDRVGFEYFFPRTLSVEEVPQVSVRLASGEELKIIRVPYVQMSGYTEVCDDADRTDLFPGKAAQLPAPPLAFGSALGDDDRKAAEQAFPPEIINVGAALCRLENCFVLGSKGCLLKGDRIIGDSLYLVHPHFDAPGMFVSQDGKTMMFDEGKRQVYHHTGPVLAVLSGGHEGYYHWMVDILPRLSIGLKLLADRNFKIILPYIEHRFQSESLALMGIPMDKVIFCRSRDILHCSELYYVSSFLHQYGGVGAYYDAPEETLVATVRSPDVFPMMTREKRTAQPSERCVYISRADATKRRMTNERELEQRLEAQGVEILRMTGVPLEQQIKLVEDVRLIIAPHGAGLTNIMFTQQPANIVELHMNNWINPCYYRLAAAAGHTYHAFICSGEEVSRNEHESTYTCDIDRLLEFVAPLISDAR